MEILPIRTDRLFARHESEYTQKALEVLRSGQYIAGKELSGFEEDFAAYLGVARCVGVASGLDALRIAFRVLGLGPGDEVIVQANTYIAGFMGISDCGALPVPVEPDEYFGLTPEVVAAAITPRTKAVLVTHLYGFMTPMEGLVSLCRARGLKLVEDCAQAHGAAWRGKKVGSFGDAACFSFYPTKNLGGFGDGGAIVTNSGRFADQCRVFRNYGSERRYYNERIGANSRLDELQAALLRVRLPYLDEMNDERNALAARYTANVANPALRLPQARAGAYNTWHQYVVRCAQRDALQAHLLSRGVHTLIHYPIPPHLSRAYAWLGLAEGSLPKTEALSREVLSIPLYNCMTAEEQDFVIGALNEFQPE